MRRPAARLATMTTTAPATRLKWTRLRVSVSPRYRRPLLPGHCMVLSAPRASAHPPRASRGGVRLLLRRRSRAPPTLRAPDAPTPSDPRFALQAPPRSAVAPLHRGNELPPPCSVLRPLTTSASGRHAVAQLNAATTLTLPREARVRLEHHPSPRSPPLPGLRLVWLARRVSVPLPRAAGDGERLPPRERASRWPASSEPLASQFSASTSLTCASFPDAPPPILLPRAPRRAAGPLGGGGVVATLTKRASAVAPARAAGAAALRGGATVLADSDDDSDVDVDDQEASLAAGAVPGAARAAFPPPSAPRPSSGVARELGECAACASGARLRWRAATTDACVAGCTLCHTQSCVHLTPTAAFPPLRRLTFSPPHSRSSCRWRSGRCIEEKGHYSRAQEIVILERACGIRSSSLRASVRSRCAWASRSSRRGATTSLAA